MKKAKIREEMYSEHKYKLLLALMSLEEETPALDSVMEKLGVDKDTIMQWAEELRNIGYSIEITSEGIKYQRPKSVRFPAAGGGEGMQELIYLPEVDSISTIGHYLAEINPVETASVFSSHQTQAPKVHSPEYQHDGRGFWGSMISTDHLNKEDLSIYNLLTIVAIIQTLNDDFKLGVQIKWPNEIVIGDRPIAHVLCELYTTNGKIDHLVTSASLYANYSPINSTEKILILNEKEFLEKFTSHVVEQHITYITSNSASMVSTFQRNLLHLGEETTIDGKTGYIVGLSPRGKLVMMNDKDEFFEIPSASAILYER